MAMSEVEQVDAETFEHTVKANHVVVVDFYADWCGPCKVIAPIMEKLSTEYDGKAKFTKIDVDENPAIAEQFEIMSIPTLIVFKNGKPVERFVGAAPAEHYRNIVNGVLE